MRTTTKFFTQIVALIVILSTVGCGSGEPGVEVPTASISGTALKSAAGDSLDFPPAPTDPNRYNDVDIISSSDADDFSGVKTGDPDRYRGKDLITRANAVRQSNEARVASEDPVVVVKTSAGEFQIRLDPKSSPVTVDNFLEYVQSGFYSGTIFHQVENGFVLAAGGYRANLSAKQARYPIRNEAHNGRRNLRGTVAIVRQDGVDSATSQFMINLADNPSLDHRSRDISETGKPDQYGYCVFGEILPGAGWDVIQQIARSRVQRRDGFEALPTQPITIHSAALVTTLPVAAPQTQPEAKIAPDLNQRLPK